MPRAPAALVSLLTAALAAQEGAEPRTETWPDDSLRERFTIDAEGRKHGTLERWTQDGTRVLQESWQHGERHGARREWDDTGRPVRADTYRQGVLHGVSRSFAPDGTTRSDGSYKDGVRDGRWVDVAESGRTRTASYKDGLLHGAVKVEQDRRTLSRQTWRLGELVELDGFRPFPTPRERLLTELREILATAAPQDPRDPKLAVRHAALLRLRAYRHLCGLRHDDLELRPEWNELCDAAAEVCRQNGKIDHHPPQPPGFDDERYRQGATGAANSNLAVGGSLASSVDSYMNDSDPSNIDRIGHRRWCLNPTLRRLGFGTADGFHAMWSMDSSGKATRGLPAIHYPPRGYTPVDLFSADRAFSIGSTGGGTPRQESLRAVVRPLDEDLVPGEPLEIDTLHMAAGGFGTGACIVFRARGIDVAPGRSYLVEISADGGKSTEHRYVVAFCEAVGATR